MSIPLLTTEGKSTMAAFMWWEDPKNQGPTTPEVTTIMATFLPRPHLRLPSIPRDICTLSTRGILSSAKFKSYQKSSNIEVF